MLFFSCKYKCVFIISFSASAIATTWTFLDKLPPSPYSLSFSRQKIKLFRAVNSKQGKNTAVVFQETAKKTVSTPAISPNTAGCNWSWQLHYSFFSFQQTGFPTDRLWIESVFGHQTIQNEKSYINVLFFLTIVIA